MFQNRIHPDCEVCDMFRQTYCHGEHEMEDGEYVACHIPTCSACARYRSDLRTNAKSAAATPKPDYSMAYVVNYTGIAVGGPRNGKVLSNNSLTILMLPSDRSENDPVWGSKPDRYDFDERTNTWVFYRAS